MGKLNRKGPAHFSTEYRCPMYVFPIGEMVFLFRNIKSVRRQQNDAPCVSLPLYIAYLHTVTYISNVC